MNKSPESTNRATGITLTQEFLLMKTRQSLPQIVKLNLWGNDLGDVSILKQVPNLEVLALTVNQISTLADFGQCHKLKELYLRRNNIPAKASELRHLKGLAHLKVLNLGENPISSQLPGYRLLVLKTLPDLEKLDDVAVSY